MTKEQSRREFLGTVAAGTAAGAGMKVFAKSAPAEPPQKRTLPHRVLGATGVSRNLDPSRAPLVGHLDGPTRVPELFGLRKEFVPDGRSPVSPFQG